MTPLHWAVQNEHEYCIKLLINYGAAVDVVSKFDKTPLSMAIEQDRMDLAQLLQLAMKVMTERAQNMELQRATLAATQSLTEELNVSESSSQDNNKGMHHFFVIILTSRVKLAIGNLKSCFRNLIKFLLNLG